MLLVPILYFVKRLRCNARDFEIQAQSIAPTPFSLELMTGSNRPSKIPGESPSNNPEKRCLLPLEMFIALTFTIQLQTFNRTL